MSERETTRDDIFTSEIFASERSFDDILKCLRRGNNTSDLHQSRGWCVMKRGRQEKLGTDTNKYLFCNKCSTFVTEMIKIKN